jgi:CRP-like cAMP-binding protein
MRFLWFTVACVWKEGLTFGEWALTNNSPRAASVLSITECELAAISKEDYDKVIKKIE